MVRPLIVWKDEILHGKFDLLIIVLPFVDFIYDDSTAPYMGVSHEVDVSHPVEYVRNCPSVAEIDSGMGMGAGVVVGYPPPEEYASYQGTEGTPLVHAEVHQLQQQQQQQQQDERESLQHCQTYVSPITPSTVTGSDIQTPHAHEPPAILMDSSSELAFALKSKNPELVSSPFFSWSRC